ncbi:MAG: hypothetical protein K9L87_05100 [Candidatus Omnitrophica bacterium]|nr:hypothetical protein [Candidatus Omnitrophota bacterium]MCF7891422.1 hypothetical protein [Candidatus Omnitrophota bacterium]MCF7895810.1 hypothetical protein [Candidatus Omnitrophota bacterium]MCF7898105.1 hypothetical protein [Candidatus Omnitrophota bacterium]MCF7908993.1 hypothetical protein [Candidatus Omnitrophota bacterium]
MKKIGLLTIFGAFLILISSVGAQEAACETEDFYVYADKNSPKNHFIPSGWMGDTNDLAFNDQATEEALSGGTSIKLTYDPEKGKGQGWAGIYWQSAQNNWGTRDSGYDLSQYNKLVFSAKGAEGGEVITGVKVGGLTTIGSTGEPVPYPDTTNTESGPIRVTDSWQEYQVNLADQDLSYINGGLAIIFNSDQAGEEQSIYIDDIRYSYDPDLTAEDDSTNFPFYVYADSSSLDNHFVPSGWMPATAAKDVQLNTNWKNLPFSGNTCIRVAYQNNSGTRWAGVYWQQPANNWGTVPEAGYDLQGAETLTFWARGDQGGEVIYEFKMGGLSSGQYPDSDSASIGPIELSKEWEKYEIDLRGRDLSYVIGGFAWATNIDVNDPDGIVFYIDEIKYEK